MEEERKFEEVFLDIKNNKPKKGMSLARYRIMADLMDGWEKKEFIRHIKTNKLGAECGTKILTNIIGVAQSDVVRLALEIARDLQVLREEEVLEKPYRFLLEKLFWAYPEDVPIDDPHWDTIKVIKKEEIE